MSQKEKDEKLKTDKESINSSDINTPVLENNYYEKFKNSQDVIKLYDEFVKSNKNLMNIIDFNKTNKLIANKLNTNINDPRTLSSFNNVTSTEYTKLINQFKTDIAQSQSELLAQFEEQINNIHTKLTDNFKISLDENIKNSFKTFSNELDSQVERFKEINDQELKNLNVTLEKTLDTLETQKIEVVEKNTELRSEQVIIFDNLKKEFENSITEKLNDVNNVLNIAKKGAHAENYSKTATSYKKSSRFWNGIGIVLTVASVYIFTKFFSNTDFVLSQNYTLNLLTKFLLTSPILSIGVYSLRQANKYEKLSVKLRFIANDLSSLDSFLDNTTAAEKIKSELAYKYYGNIHNDNFDSTNGLFITPDMLLKLDSKQFEALRAIFNHDIKSKNQED